MPIRSGKSRKGQRRNYKEKWNLLKPHFAGVKVTDVDAKFLLALRETRSQARTRNGEPVKPATLKKDIDFVRLVLRHAKQIEKCLDELPQFPSLIVARRGRSFPRRGRS